MTDNRGLLSATSQKSIDGLHKEKQLSYQTLKDMEVVNDNYIKFAKKFGVTLDDVAKVLNKSVENIVKTNKETENSIKEYEKNINDMKKKYRGANKHIADEYEKYAKTQIAELEKTSNELRETTRKNIIKESFKREKEEHSVKLLDSKYIKHDFRDLIKNEYESELEKLNISALETFGESFKTNPQYQNALSELGKEFTNKAFKESFKDESKRNEIKFINNKFAKNNNLANTSNEYYNQLEKLKSDALDTYGEGFENNKAYKKVLMNLNDKYAQDMKDAWKEDFKENHKVLGGIASGIKDTFERNKETLQGLLGPLNLFIAPMKEFFGGFGAVFKFIGGGVKKLFGKFTKKNPTASDVLKSGAFGVGALYIGSKLEKMFGTTKDEKEGIFDKLKNNLLDKLGLGKDAGWGGILKGGASKFLTMGHGAVAGGLGILGGGALMAKDAMKGVQMAGQGEWSESKIASGMGGLLGGFDSGFKGAFKNMGKWALMGFGIGNIICPIVGGLIGGLIGGAIGGILGWIGGEKISKVMESVGTFFKGVFTKTTEGLKKGWTKTKEFAKLAKDKTIMKSKQVKEAIGTFVASSAKAIGEKVSKMKDFASNMWGGLKNLGSEAWDSFKDGTLFTDFVPNLLNKIKDKLFEGFDMLKESPLGQFVQKLFENIQNGMTKFFDENPIGKWMDSYIIAPIKNAFGQMGAWFSYIGNAFDEGGITGALSAMTVGMLKKDKETGLTQFDVYKQNLLNPTNVDDAIIRTDGSIIKTNPKDTLVALKNVPLSMEQVRNDTTKNLNSSLSNLGSDKTLEKKLTTIIDVLSKILDKDVQVNLPPQTRGDLDIIMSGGMI